jgi:DNA invertase Pin-like site-specific DNA recombinase
MQTRELCQFAEARGWQIAGEYIDAGVSGTKDSRPELNRLLADAHKRRFDIVCVWRFDRFARVSLAPTPSPSAARSPTSLSVFAKHCSLILLRFGPAFRVYVRWQRFWAWKRAASARRC